MHLRTHTRYISCWSGRSFGFEDRGFSGSAVLRICFEAAKAIYLSDKEALVMVAWSKATGLESFALALNSSLRKRQRNGRIGITDAIHTWTWNWKNAHTRILRQLAEKIHVYWNAASFLVRGRICFKEFYLYVVPVFSPCTEELLYGS